MSVTYQGADDAIYLNCLTVYLNGVIMHDLFTFKKKILYVTCNNAKFAKYACINSRKLSSS